MTTNDKTTRTASAARTVLIAVTGSSPAILTEAIWALAQETPAVIPDLIVVVTTTHGAHSLREKLLQPVPGWSQKSVWQSLRHTILGDTHETDPRLTLESPVLIALADPRTGTSHELEDIRSPSDNAAAAETILTSVRRFSTDAETRLVGLLSGGRKTMSALLHAALSLAGRPGDRLLHVLVSEPFDNPRLVPTFYFPGQPGSDEHSLPGSGLPKIAHLKARIDLADVPLVALGELVFNRSGQSPASFASFTRIARSQVEGATLQSIPIKVTFSRTSRRLSVNQFFCDVPTGRPSALCEQIINDAQNDLSAVDRGKLANRWEKRGVTYTKPDGIPSKFTDDDISNALNVIREKLLEDGGVPEIIMERLFPKRAPVGLNREGISVKLSD